MLHPFQIAGQEVGLSPVKSFFHPAVMEILAIRVTNTATKGARQQLYTLSHTLRQLLAALNTQHISFTKQHLAEYLGISVRSLNRLLKDSFILSKPG